MSSRLSRCARVRSAARSWLWVLTLVVYVAGLSRATAQEVLIPEADAWKYFKGTEEPPADWNTVDFDDSSWLEGLTPIGYSTDLTYGTILADMQNSYYSVYIRKIFTVDDVDAASLLTLQMKYDDGFLAFINGVEVHRVNLDPAGSAVPFNTPTSAQHETNAVLEGFSLDCNASDLLQEGDNVLAIQGHNTNLTSSDFALEVVLQSVGDACPTEFTSTVVTSSSGVNSVRLDWKTPAGITYDSVQLFRDGEELPLTNPALLYFVDRDLETGEYVYELVAVFCEEECLLDTTAIVEGGGAKFRRGDSDDNSEVNLTDAVFVLMYLFRGGADPTCLDAADTNDDGQVNLTDSVYLLQALFQGGPQPAEPGILECGTEPAGSEDSFEDCVYTSC